MTIDEPGWRFLIPAGLVNLALLTVYLVWGWVPALVGYALVSCFLPRLDRAQQARERASWLLSKRRNPIVPRRHPMLERFFFSCWRCWRLPRRSAWWRIATLCGARYCWC